MAVIRTDPLPAFRFLIVLADSGSWLRTLVTGGLAVASELVFDGGFSACTGLSMDTEITTYAEGGRNDWVHRLPGRTSYPNLTLRWGMAFNNRLWEWHYNTARALAYGKPFLRKDGLLIILDYQAPTQGLFSAGPGSVAGAAGAGDLGALGAQGLGLLNSQAWIIKGGVPARWLGPELDANQSAAAVEGLEIAHHGLERIWPPNLSAMIEGGLEKLGVAL